MWNIGCLVNLPLRARRLDINQFVEYMRSPGMSLVVLCVACASAQGSPAVRGIVDAFAHHRVVAVAEAHGLRQAGDFYIALARDTGFQRIAPDIVIEFASRQSQPLLDRYVVRGDSVALDTLRSIWRNTTKVASWESPVYARWLTAIRDVNRTLPAARRMRVLAGDTPVSWTDMHAPADWQMLGDNNVSFADVITNEVLAKGHRAFVVLGSNHLMRTGARDDGPNTTTRVESKYPGSMYVAWLYNGRPGSPDADARMMREAWTTPSLVSLRGSWAGAIPVGAHRFDEAADAVLYLGPSVALEQDVPAPDSFEMSYVRELDRRSWIEWGDSTRAGAFLHLVAPRPSGTVTEFSVASKQYGRDRRIWVYLPPDYPSACRQACSLLVTFDGGVYLGAIPLPNMLDSLITAGRMSSTVVLLIDNSSGVDRLADLANHAKFAAFVGDELLPWLYGKWNVTHDPSRTIAAGSSAGGLAAAYLAFQRPDLFGNVLSQSGAFWRGNEGSNEAPFEWLTQQYAAAPKRPIRFFLDVGATESVGAMGGVAPSILEANRHLRDALRAKGYAVSYLEVPNGIHAPEAWRTRLPTALVSLSSLPQGR